MQRAVSGAPPFFWWWGNRCEVKVSPSPRPVPVRSQTGQAAQQLCRFTLGVWANKPACACCPQLGLWEGVGVFSWARRRGLGISPCTLVPHLPQREAESPLDPVPQVESGIRCGSVETQDPYLLYWWKISRVPPGGAAGEGWGPGNRVAGGCPSQVAVSWLLPWRLSASPSCPLWRGRREWLHVCFWTTRKLRKGSPAQLSPAAGLGQWTSLFATARTGTSAGVSAGTLAWAGQPLYGFWGSPAPLILPAAPAPVYPLSINTHVAYLASQSLMDALRKEAVLEMTPPSTTGLVPCKARCGVCKPEGCRSPRKILLLLSLSPREIMPLNSSFGFSLLLSPFFPCCFYTCIILWSLGITAGKICIWLPLACISLSSGGHLL